MHISQKVFPAHCLQYQTYCILVEHNLYIEHYHTTAYIILANLASWEWGYANCNSTYLVKPSTLSGIRLAASKTAVRSWIVKIQNRAISQFASRDKGWTPPTRAYAVCHLELCAGLDKNSHPVHGSASEVNHSRVDTCRSFLLTVILSSFILLLSS